MTPQKVKIERLWDVGDKQEGVAANCDEDDHSFYLVDKMRTLAKEQKLPVFSLPLAHINLECENFEIKDVVDFARHMLHVNEADLSDPILMSCRGRILDGRHRIVKALMEGKRTIKCQRFTEDLEPH